MSSAQTPGPSGPDAHTAADHPQGDGSGNATRPNAQPDLTESLRQLGATGRAGLNAGKDTVKAFRGLLAADVALARSAFGRTLALMGVAIVFGASAWLLLMAALMVFLARQIGLSWSLSLLVCGLLSGGIAGWAVWQAQRYFEHTRLKATRRQLARLGIGELSDFMPDPGSGDSARNASKRAAAACADGPPTKTEHGVDVTPP